MATIKVRRRGLRPWRLVAVLVILFVTSAVAEIGRGVQPAAPAVPSPEVTTPATAGSTR